MIKKQKVNIAIVVLLALSVYSITLGIFQMFSGDPAVYNFLGVPVLISELPAGLMALVGFIILFFGL